MEALLQVNSVVFKIFKWVFEVDTLAFGSRKRLILPSFGGVTVDVTVCRVVSKEPEGRHSSDSLIGNQTILTRTWRKRECEMEQSSAGCHRKGQDAGVGRVGIVQRKKTGHSQGQYRLALCRKNECGGERIINKR